MANVLSFLLFATIILYSGKSFSKHSECNFVIPVGDNYYPYMYRDNNNHYTGLDYDLFLRSAKRLACDVEHVSKIPVKRLVSNNKNLPINTVLAVTPNEARKGVYLFSTPYRQETIRPVFLRSKLLEYKTIHSLFRQIDRIGYYESGYYGEEFEKLRQEFKHKLVHIESTRIALEMLKLNRITVFLGDPVNVSYIAEMQGMQNVFVSPLLLVQQDISFAFDKSIFNDGFVNRFNEALYKEMNK